MNPRTLVFPGGINATIYTEFKVKNDEIEYTGHFTNSGVYNSLKFKVEMTIEANDTNMKSVMREAMTLQIADLMYQQLINEFFMKDTEPAVVPKRKKISL